MQKKEKMRDEKIVTHKCDAIKAEKLSSTNGNECLYMNTQQPQQ